MKRKSIFTLFLLLSTSIFTSCEKSAYDADKQPQKEKTVADLVVPNGFDWKMTKNAQCKITAQSVSDVLVYSDRECTENAMLATLQTNDGILTIPLSLPANSKEAYLQYETVMVRKQFWQLLPTRTISFISRSPRTVNRVLRQGRETEMEEKVKSGILMMDGVLSCSKICFRV